MGSHRIEKQNLHLSFFGIDDSVEVLSARLSTFNQQMLLPAINETLKEADNHKFTVRIESLEINAGIIKEENWETELVKRICSELKEKIQDSVKMARQSPAPQNESGQPEEPDWVSLVLQYLQTGELPWHHPKTGAAVFFARLHQLLDSGYFQQPQILQKIVSNPMTLQRFIRQYSPAAIARWLRNWNLSRYNTAVDNFKRRRQDPAVINEDEAAVQVAAVLLEFSEIEKSGPLKGSHLFRQENVEEMGTDPIPDFEEAIFPMHVATKKESFIENAGLILLHPFLPAFFKKLNWIDEDKKWYSDYLQRRGVLCLHALAFPGEIIPEYELPLCKILCGLPLHQPLESTWNPDADEQAEMRELLMEVIQRWSVLKSTTPEGLQEGYFQRPGKLMRDGDTWRLIVETQTQDVLLNHLPWGIGIVKTPWMSELLFTDWAY